MRGAEALVRTLVAGGVEVCFTNPGTSEMQFVAALDAVPELRAVLVLFEGVAAGAADGYARMAEKPAATLLHLGPGLANGLANFHNARRAEVPIVNIVGEHATWHLQVDAPLTSDIAGYARQVSKWVHTTANVHEIAADTAAAIAAARRSPGQIATLITPANCTWEECSGSFTLLPDQPVVRVSEEAVRQAAALLRSGEPTMLLLGGRALRAEALALAGQLAARWGTRLASPTFFQRMQRGAGRVAVERVPYAVQPALDMLAGVRHLILVGAKPPVAFFAYPNLPSRLTPIGMQIHTLAEAGSDLEDALARLADLAGVGHPAATQALGSPALPSGPLTPQTIAQAVATLLPEGCIVVDEGVTSGLAAWPITASAAPHDWLVLMGGAIGEGMPMAVGAAIASPNRRVLNLQADGSAAYTLQALWTQAREQLDITTVLFANRAYRILELEYANVGVGREAGPLARRLMRLDQPVLDWVQLAQGMGVPAVRTETSEEFANALRRALHEPGPNLIEAVIG